MKWVFDVEFGGKAHVNVEFNILIADKEYPLSEIFNDISLSYNLIVF